ncbi:MAG: imidazolonepropionase [Calditrichaeota bacterium]|nr:MAG: imidazolonepropionase [Calditrichota bacterium]
MLRILTNIKGIITPSSSQKSLQVKEGVAVAIRDETIVEIDTPENLRSQYPEASIMDGKGYWAMPGFVDPHTHPVFYKTREEEFAMRIAGKSYEEIAAAGGGIRNSVRAFRKASFDELVELTYKRIRKFLEFGTTTIEAKSGYGLTLEDEIKSLRILKHVASLTPITIVPTFLGAHEVPDEYQSHRDKYVDLIVNEMIPAVAEEQLAVFCDVFCEKNVFTIEQSERILRAANDYGLIPKLHADELFYTGGAELAARVNAISADHLVKISDEGIAAMKQSGVIAVLLPGTTFYLGKSEYAPARKLIDAGVEVALATDFNPGSSMTHNMQLMLTIANLYLKMSPEETLKAATLTAAKAIKLEKEVGTLEKGKKADIILLDIPRYQYLPYHYGVNHVKMVIRHGKLVHQVDA